jgi:hypothetical protein
MYKYYYKPSERGSLSIRAAQSNSEENRYWDAVGKLKWKPLREKKINTQAAAEMVYADVDIMIGLNALLKILRTRFVISDYSDNELLQFIALGKYVTNEVISNDRMESYVKDLQKVDLCAIIRC